MSLFLSFFDNYLKQFNAMTLIMSFIVLLLCIFLCVLTIYSIHHILLRNKELNIRIKLLTILSTLSFLCYIISILSAMIFSQLAMMQHYTYCIGISYILMTFGKQSMYLLFLEALIKTFKQSLFQISSKIHKLVISLIMLNFVIYLITIYLWMMENETASYIAYLIIVCSVFIEIFYSLFIVALFCRNLFVLNVARIDQHKSQLQQYAKRVRSATIDIVKDHKNRLKLERSLSVPASIPSEIHSAQHSQQKSFTNFTVNASSTFTDIKLPSFTRNTSGNKSTLSLRQTKSLNITKFNKKHKAMLDAHQLSVIDTAAKHTVLCCIAFLTSLQLSVLIGTEHQMPTNGMKQHFIVAFVAVLNALTSALCVILRYNDDILNKIYCVLCCGPSICCRHCFLYCSLRKVMTQIEDQVQEEVDAEITIDLSIQQDLDGKRSTLKPKALEKLQSLSVNSQVSVTQSPTCTPMAQGNKTPSFFLDIIEMDDNDNQIVCDIDSEPRRLNITVTRPNNKEKENVPHSNAMIEYPQYRDDDENETDSEDMNKDIVFV